MPETKQCAVSTMVFTLNEEVNLPHCLESLKWCDDVIVVDSGSSDRTEEIAHTYHVRWFCHEFTGFGDQRNWAVENTNPKHAWILILDADERVPQALAEEVNQLAMTSGQHIGAARVRRRFYMWGKWLRYSSLYPTWVVRFIHRDRVRYVNRGHAETQKVTGKILALENDLLDENYKDLEDWFDRQNRYSHADAQYEIEQEKAGLSVSDILSTDPLIRKMALKRLSWKLPFRAGIYFLYGYLFRRGFMDGKKGFLFCRLRAQYQRMIVLKKLEIKYQQK